MRAVALLPLILSGCDSRKSSFMLLLAYHLERSLYNSVYIFYSILVSSVDSLVILNKIRTEWRCGAGESKDSLTATYSQVDTGRG